MISKIRKFIDKYSTAIKLIFVLSVLTFVIRETGRILKEVSGQQLKNTLAGQSTGSLVLMLIFGFLAITPMLIYDFSIIQFLPSKYSRFYVLKSGWVVNTFTNLLGFGGLLGASLRAHFYGKGATRRQVVYAISKVALFLIAGLSILCQVSLILIFGFGIGSQFAHYWVWLVGGGGYFPALMVFTKVTNSAFFSDLTLKQEITMTFGSTMEWSSCVGFFILIGYLMGVKANLAAVIPIFVVANVAGVISMIPGGLGSFDVFMIIGLSFLGVTNSDAVVWVLLYRLFYYLLPFLVGVVLFINDTGSKLNHFLDNLPTILLQRFSQIFLTVFMYFTGIMMLLFATVPNVVIANKMFIRVVPFSIIFVSHLANVIVAFLLIGLATGIWMKIKRAFIPTTVVLILSMIDVWFNEAFTWRMVLLIVVILLTLWVSRKALYRERMANSWGMSILNWSIFGVTFIVYSLIGIATHTNSRLHFNQAYLFPSEAVWAVGFIGLLVAVVILILINWYLTAKKPDWLKQGFDPVRVKSIIDSFGGNEVSHLAFLRDKKIYYYQEDGEDQVFFMFQEIADKLVIMGEPIGNQQKVPAAIDKFMEQADIQGYRLVFYEINEGLTMQLHENGFDFIKFGEDGLVDVQKFTLSGKRHRGERALMNKFDREGYKFEILQPPFTRDQFWTFKQISDTWLDGRAEKGFSLGFFDQFYLNQSPVAVMRNPEGKVVSFANLMPTGNKKTTSIDLMRSGSDAPSGIMDGVLINLYNDAKEKGYHYFDLGMSPMANVGTSRFSFTDERIVHLIYEYGYKLYSFEGLYSYKEKYVDVWQPKYIAYYRGSSLIYTMLQVLILVSRRIKESPKIFHPLRQFWQSLQ